MGLELGEFMIRKIYYFKILNSFIVMSALSTTAVQAEGIGSPVTNS